MSEQDEKASYIDILEEELKNAEEEIATLRMQEEHDWIDQRHELALIMDRNIVVESKLKLAESVIYWGMVNKDHEIALWMDEYMERHGTEAVALLRAYVDHFNKHSLNYMSEKLNRITAQARKVVD